MLGPMMTTVISPPDTSTLPNDQAAAVDHAYRRLQALNAHKGTRYEIRHEFGGWCVGMNTPDGFFAICDPILDHEPLTVILPHLVGAFVMGVQSWTAGIR